MMVLLVSLALGAQACSGPGAAELIARNGLFAWVALGVGVILAVLASAIARQRGLRFRSVLGAWVLVVAHPTLWLDARSGDCGIAMVDGAAIFTVLLVGLVLWARLRPVRQRD